MVIERAHKCQADYQLELREKAYENKMLNEKQEKILADLRKA